MQKSNNKVAPQSVRQMDHAEYTKKRNDLLALLTDIRRSCPGLAEETRRELDEVAERLQRNCFEIVLAGQFQGGKSTTFDTLCGGREISPRGFGIKTSACSISAVSLPDSEPEYAEIAWKTPKALLLTMATILDRQLQDEQADVRTRFEEQQKDPNAKVLASCEDLAVIRRCLEKEWAVRLERKSRYDPEDSGRLDMLWISSLILLYLDDPELVRFRKRTRVTLEELKELVVFPTNWKKRWLAVEAGDGNARDIFDRIRGLFSAKEVLFVFLAGVVCRIHCDDLTRLGCVITDSPGLFADKWDTMVAESAMLRADAILYLLGGRNQIGEPDEKMFDHIISLQQGHKLFLACNAKASFDTLEKTVLPKTFKEIREKTQLALSSPGEIAVFNARLACDAARMSRGEALTEEESLWLDTALKLAGGTPGDRDPEKLLVQSGFKGLLGRIEDLIVRRRFRAILVDNGVDKAVAAMGQLRTWLKGKVELAETDAAEAERLQQEAEEKFARFEKQVKQWVSERIGKPELVRYLQENYVRKVFHEQIPFISRNLSALIRHQVLSSKTFIAILTEFFSGSVKDRLQEMLKPGIEDIISEAVSGAHIGWMENVSAGQNQTYNYHMRDKTLLPLQKEIRALWDREYQVKNAFLNGIPLEFASPETSDAAGTVSGDPELSGQLIDHLRRRFGLQALGAVIAFIAGAVVFITVGWIWGVITAFIAALMGTFSVDKILDTWDKKFVADFQNQIQQKLRTYFKNDGKESLEKSSLEVVERLIDQQKEMFENSLRKAKKDLQTRIEDAQKFHQQKSGEKARVAAECRKIHDEQVVPACRRIERFQSEMGQYR